MIACPIDITYNRENVIANGFLGVVDNMNRKMYFVRISSHSLELAIADIQVIETNESLLMLFSCIYYTLHTRSAAAV